MKKHLKLILRTLFSNNACVEAARTKETKYTVVAIVFAILALFFAALPTCVTGFQQNGGSCVRGVTYNFENGMLYFKDKIIEKGVTIKIAENEKHQHTFAPTDWNNMDPYTWNDGTKTIIQNDLRCFISILTNKETGKAYKSLEVYYCDESVCPFSLFVEEIAKNINPLAVNGYTDNKDKKAREDNPANFLEAELGEDGQPSKLIARTTSFLVFGTTQVQMAICPPGISQIASSVYGDYGNTPFTAEGKDFIKDTLVPSNKPEEILKSCATFFDQVYVNPRRANTWKSTGIILGVDGGVILLMGFMVWVLTRGKNNPFRIYSFWDGQKIAYYAALTPGILSLFGFLMSNMAMMLFILGTGVRVMWLSMRTLRYQAPAKQ